MGDLISRKALIKELELHCHDECKTPNSMGYLVTGAIRDCMKIVNRQPTIEAEAVVHERWIPCSDRLPETDGSYMTTTEYGAVRVNHFYPRNKTWGYKSNRTIAWMPLPELYKGGGQNE